MTFEIEALCACVRVCVSESSVNLTRLWYFLVCQKHRWCNAADSFFTCSLGGTVLSEGPRPRFVRGRRGARGAGALLTKDLPVLGVLGDQVEHVLGLHHLREEEEEERDWVQTSGQCSQATLIRSSTSSVLPKKTINIRRKEERTHRHEMLHNASLHTALSKASPRSLASGKLRAKQ